VVTLGDDLEPTSAVKGSIIKAVEAILIEEGYARVTTRNIATRANVNQALVHYYFGSIDKLLYVVLDRTVQRAVLALKQSRHGEQLGAQAWASRARWRLTTNVDRGLSKLWLELCAMALNNDEMKVRLSQGIQDMIDLESSLAESFWTSPPGTDISYREFAEITQAAFYGALLEQHIEHVSGAPAVLAVAEQLAGLESAASDG